MAPIELVDLLSKVVGDLGLSSAATGNLVAVLLSMYLLSGRPEWLYTFWGGRPGEAVGSMFVRLLVVLPIAAFSIGAIVATVAPDATASVGT